MSGLPPVGIGHKVFLDGDLWEVYEIDDMADKPNLKAVMVRVGVFEPVIYYARRILRGRQRANRVMALHRRLKNGSWAG